MALLPADNLWDSVSTAEPIQRKSWLGRLACEHEETTTFTLTDHRNGPSPVTDTYIGTVCRHCGYILTKEKVY